MHRQNAVLQSEVHAFLCDEPEELIALLLFCLWKQSIEDVADAIVIFPKVQRVAKRKDTDGVKHRKR